MVIRSSLGPSYLHRSSFEEWAQTTPFDGLENRLGRLFGRACYSARFARLGALPQAGKLP